MKTGEYINSYLKHEICTYQDKLLTRAKINWIFPLNNSLIDYQVDCKPD